MAEFDSGMVQEGELRPQLLDRFGLSVSVSTMSSIAARTRMVMDRLAFEQVRQTALWNLALLPGRGNHLRTDARRCPLSEQP